MMKTKLFIFAAVFLLSAFFSLLEASQISVRAQPKSEIIVAADAMETEKYAAGELQFWLCRVTGALIPVLDKPTEKDNTKIFIGASFAPEPGADMKTLGDTDGFAVRNSDKGKKIFIFGAIPKGTLNGVYAFLENNTDIIWPRPDWELGAVYAPAPDLSAKNIDTLEKPRSTLRGWGFTVTSVLYDQQWQSRNRANYLGYISDGAVRMGAKYLPAGGGHGLKLFMDPKQYFESHPEYFPLQKGKRVPGGQLCFTAYEMIPTYIENLRKALDSRPDSNGVNVSITDGWGLCDCPRCLATIKLPDGKELISSDPAFRSTQHFIFLNKIAVEIAKTHPRVDILTYAYIFAVIPPPIKLEPNIRVMYCPFVKDDKFPIFDEKRNRQWREYTLGWGKASPKTFLREYYGCASEFPRPIEDVVQKDLQFCLENGIHEFNSELPVDRRGHVSKPDDTWDVSAMTMWIITRLWWDPSQDLDKLRGHYLSRTYREAGPAMTKYYKLIHDSWYASTFPSVYSDDRYSMAKTYILEAGIENACREALQEAGKAVKHPISRELVLRQIKQFESWMERAKNDKTVRLKVPLSSANISNDAESPEWEKGAKTEDFVVCNAPDQKPLIRTYSIILHDRSNLYVKTVCYAPDMETLKGSEKKQDGSETFPRGDHLELFLANPVTGIYYHFAYDCGNEAVFDAKGYDSKWTGNWSRSIKRYPDRWESIATIPLEDIGCNITENNKLRFLPYRSKYSSDGTKDKNGKEVKKREQSSWGGGFVHQPTGFGEITLDQN
ncbi:MAG TPA: hypothetical protein DET40_06950 [Lentisphaeria bacterium]|nr:MAG: hypothetical protein A2X45_07350 [Lentisphaerae bacterium GWF2_50_93]HCE43268.1 hypothetical protein [Lentisphaeria bacterium]